jgi:hypothetical protein
MFIRLTGKPNIEWYAKTVSTAISNGALVYAGGSGGLIPADSTSGDHVGIAMKDVASTDADYASATKIPVDVPREGDEFIVDVSTGTALTAAMVGNRYDLTDSLNINVGATSKKVVTITRFISATKAVVKINAMIAHVDVATS